MLLIKSNKKTPGSRWRLWVNYKKLKFTNPYKSSALLKFNNNTNFNKILKSKVFSKKKFAYVKNYSFKIKHSSIIIDMIVNTFMVKNNVIIKNYYNFFNTYPKSYLSFPGYQLEKYCDTIKLSKLEYYFNCFLPLLSVPINFSIFYIFNNKNIKPTFSLSPGSNSVRKKLLKKTKFILVLLPSKKLKYCLANTICLFSPNKSNKNKVVRGKFGLNLSKFSKISVRGVAKNPVDHPNGGRTKAKQPEKSPWGWVAKINK